MTVEDAWPLSPLQEGLLFHSLLDDRSVDVYTIQVVVDFQGPLDAVRLRIAAQGLLDRHSCLRTAFALVNDSPMQVVARGVQVPWVEVDLSDRPIEYRFRQCDRLVEDDRITRFDLQTPPLVRFLLVKLGEAHHRVVLTAHHILLDGWSMALMMRDFFTLYASGGDVSALPEVRPFYDHLLWLATQDRAAALAAWVQALREIEEPTLLAAANRSRPLVIPEKVDADISQSLTSQLTSFARAQGLTLNTLVQVAWAIVLSRLVGRSDVVFGMVVSGRSPELPGYEQMLGLFINTIPVRVQIDSSESLADLLQRSQDEQFQLLDYRYIGLAELQHEVGVGALFDTLTVFQSFPFDLTDFTQALDGTGITSTMVEIHGSTHYPIVLVAVPGTRLQIELKYRPDLFDVSTVQIMAERVVRALELMVTDARVRVSGIDILSPRERYQLLMEWNDAAAEVEKSTLLELCTAQIRRTPNAIAVVCGAESVTYAELDKRACRLAEHLIRHGSGPEGVVGVCLGRSVDLVVALLGVLRTGAAFVALEPEWPAARIEQVCRSAGAEMLVTDTAMQIGSAGVPRIEIDNLPESCESAPAVRTGASVPVDPEGLAYLIFTSGSTGAPKGVMIRNCAIAARLLWQRQLLGLGSRDAVLFKASLGFDISINEIFLPLVSGARLVVAEPGGERDIEYLLKVIERERVTFVYLVPSMLDMLLQSPDVAVRGRALKHVWCGGEALGPALFDRFQATLDAVMYHGYGPAEATIGVTHQFYRPGQSRDGVTIGWPNPNTRIYLLDQWLHPAPIGVIGELYIGGLPLGRGYVNDPRQTASRFVADPFFAGERLYRTGDLARWRPEGLLEFCGRADNQIKIRGMRVELEEIEAVLEQHPQIRQAVVTTDTSPSGTTRLVGYCLVTHEHLDRTRLHSWTATRLPEHMVPAAFVTLEAMPLTPNGKIDRQALPAPSFDDGQMHAEFIPPQGTEEMMVAKVWAEILRLDRVGRDDNFFKLGGDSLLGARMVLRLRGMLQLEVPLRELFRRPTVRGFTAALTPPGRASAAVTEVPLAVNSPRGQQVPQPWPDSLPPPVRHCGDNVLLTGASGFFGAFLLREILAQYRGTVHCLVRADSATKAWDKLRANLERYALAEEILTQNRIRIVVGDLARPHLGLGDDEYELLADEIDSIIHNGAHVNALHSYETVRAANVNGTRELLWLAATTWRKPLRFVSTVSAAKYSSSAPGGGSGYAESKWQAEQVVAEARAHGIPAAVYRAPRLSGDSQTGRGNHRDIMLRMIRWILDLETAPDIDVSEDWIPVDEAARLLVSPSHGPEHGGSFVLTAQSRVRLTDVIKLARRLGHAIEYKPTQEWLRDLENRSAEEHEVLFSALHGAAAEGKLGARVLTTPNDAPNGNFVPIVAHGVTEKILRQYLCTASQVPRIG